MDLFGKPPKAKAPKAPSPLIDRIGEKFFTEEPVPPLTSKDYIRCSAFSNMCPREEVLCTIHSKMRIKKIEPDLNLIFSHGAGLHYILQNRVLPAIDDVLYGEWRCLRCGRMHGIPKPGDGVADYIITKPTKCDAGCPNTDFLYEEKHVTSPQYRLSGHPDGFLKLPQYEGFGILEAKSISPKGAWEVRKVPKMDHVIQAQLYLWFTGLQWSQILYWDKGTNGTAGLIEHHIERDDDTIEESLSDVQAIWDGVAAAEKGEKLLPERICITAGCPRANACAVSKQCFEDNS